MCVWRQRDGDGDDGGREVKTDKVTNIVVAGIGGQGVITCSDILADAAFRSGYDVKKAEIHGMSQRGGSVSTDVRFGREVLSPTVPAGEADFLVVAEPTQVENNLPVLKPAGVLIRPEIIEESKLSSKRNLNVALLGVLSRYLPIEEKVWVEAIKANLAEKLHEGNLAAFQLGREAAKV